MGERKSVCVCVYVCVKERKKVKEGNIGIYADRIWGGGSMAGILKKKWLKYKNRD